MEFSSRYQWLISVIVNEILGEHNVDKQISDSRGDASSPFHSLID